MKIGDLVRYIEVWPHREELGIILDGPRPSPPSSSATSYKVYWIVEKKIGWWDHFRLEVINEIR